MNAAKESFIAKLSVSEREMHDDLLAKMSPVEAEAYDLIANTMPNVFSDDAMVNGDVFLAAAMCVDILKVMGFEITKSNHG